MASDIENKQFLDNEIRPLARNLFPTLVNRVERQGREIARINKALSDLQNRLGLLEVTDTKPPKKFKNKG